MIREEREESRDIEETEKIGCRPEQKFNVVEDVVESSFSLGVRNGKGCSRFKRITS